MLKKRKRELDYEYEERYDEEDEDEIDLLEIFMMVRRHLRVIVVITAIFTLLGVGFAMTRKNIYKASSTLIVSKAYYGGNNIDRNELSMNQQLATTYTAVAKNPSVLNAVIRKLDLETTAKDLEKLVSITPVEDTELIKITAEDGNAVMASRIANEMAAEFISKVKDVMSFENIKVVEPAMVPELPEPKKRALIIAVAMVLGAMVGTFSVIVVEMFHSKIRRPKDIERIMGVSILTHVPRYDQIDELEQLHENSKMKKVLKLGEIGKKKSGGKN